MSTAKTDDIEAVRAVFDTIKDFNPEDQQRILRWVAEKAKLPQPFSATGSTSSYPSPPPPLPIQGSSTHTGAQPSGGGKDIKSFMGDKKPRNDVQFAASVAYYYRFEASQSERKETINKEDLQEAARKAGRERFSNPLKTLNNAHQLGLLDRGSEKATFSINSVGENLVAMTLPDGAVSVKSPKKKARKVAGRKSQTKRAAKKSAKKA